jgi:hypothetical protein
VRPEELHLLPERHVRCKRALGAIHHRRRLRARRL